MPVIILFFIFILTLTLFATCHYINNMNIIWWRTMKYDTMNKWWTLFEIYKYITLVISLLPIGIVIFYSLHNWFLWDFSFPYVWIIWSFFIISTKIYVDILFLLKKIKKDHMVSKGNKLSHSDLPFLPCYSQAVTVFRYFISVRKYYLSY